MKKTGFTLAEVLITLGIIGVVAALTTPALVQNTGTAKVGPSIMKALNSWNLANENMLSDQESSGLKSLGITDGKESDYITLLKNYMKISEYDNSQGKYSVTDYNGAELPTNISMEIKRVDSIAMAGRNKEVTLEKKISPKAALSNVMLSNDGILYALNINSRFYDRIVYVRNGMSGSFTSSYYDSPVQSFPNHTLGYGTVLIDINGLANPNKLGKDVFAFQLNADGSLSPWGDNGAWEGTNNLMTASDPCNATSVGTGATCAASVLENNRKVIY